MSKQIDRIVDYLVIPIFLIGFFVGLVGVNEGNLEFRGKNGMDKI